MVLSVLLIGVSSRSHHGEEHLRRSEEEDFARRSEALADSDDEDLLQQIDELDTMIKLARNARSIKEDEDPDSMVAEDEIIKVMDSVDLTSTDNVEALSEVLKTLPGDVQLEFLMNKFMMKDAKVKEEIIHSKTGTSASSSKVKRSTYSSRGFSHGRRMRLTTMILMFSLLSKLSQSLNTPTTLSTAAPPFPMRSLSQSPATDGPLLNTTLMLPMESSSTSILT